MSSERGSASRRFTAGLFAIGFTMAVAAVLASQLALMSVLDSQRAERAAQEIADSRFTGQLIEQTVTRAIGPVLDPQLATQIAAFTSADPQVRGVVRSSLIGAHRQVVESAAATPTATQAPDGAAGSPGPLDGNETVRAAITAAIIEAGARNGVDLSGFTDQVGTPQVVPDDLPEFGLRTVAERTRLIAGLAAIAFALLAVLIHPRPGRSLAGLGLRAGIVCGAWLAGLLVAGWVIDLIADTLFGEMLESIWSAAVPSMILLTVAGVVLSAGIWFGGVAIDGLSRDRRPPAAPPSGGYEPEYRQPSSGYYDY